MVRKVKKWKKWPWCVFFFFNWEFLNVRSLWFSGWHKNAFGTNDSSTKATNGWMNALWSLLLHVASFFGFRFTITEIVTNPSRSRMRLTVSSAVPQNWCRLLVIILSQQTSISVVFPTPNPNIHPLIVQKLWHYFKMTVQKMQAAKYERRVDRFLRSAGVKGIDRHIPITYFSVEIGRSRSAVDCSEHR